jgi:hypothetical protein
MIKLLIAGSVGIIFIFALIIIIRNKPDLWFWIFLNLFFDPGGYIYEYLEGTLLGPLQIADVCMAGMIICLFFEKIKWEAIYQDQFLKKFLFYFFLFALYYFIVYGGIVPYFNNDLDYSTFLVKNRRYPYSFIILIAVYVFSLKNLYYFYTTTLFVGIICLTLFFVTLVTGVELVPLVVEARYTGSEMMRISMSSYGIFYLLFPVSLTAYFLSRKINLNLKYKQWLYYSGIIFILAQIITLTRREQIDIIGTALIISLILSYLFRTGKLSSVFKIIMPAILVLAVLYFTFPKYVGYLAKIGEDTFLLMTTGIDSEGRTDQRVTGNSDYELVKEYIGKNILFGTGYTYLVWKDGIATSARGEEYSRARDAAGEVNIYFLLFGYGIAGAILMIPLYYIMVKFYLKLIRLLKLKLINYLEDPLTIILSVYILSVIASRFTYQLWGLSADFTGGGTSFTAVLMGVGLALYRKIWLNLYGEAANGYKASLRLPFSNNI